jgi:DNA invertase Pin-like site-specific DNA recombinase
MKRYGYHRTNTREQHLDRGIAEIEKKEKRQCEGIEAKKARGDWSDYGRPAMSKTSFYRYVKKIRNT